MRPKTSRGERARRRMAMIQGAVAFMVLVGWDLKLFGICGGGGLAPARLCGVPGTEQGSRIGSTADESIDEVRLGFTREHALGCDPNHGIAIADEGLG
jgi:hypothetical protein